MEYSIEQAIEIFARFLEKFGLEEMSGGRFIGAVELIREVGEKEALKILEPYKRCDFATAGLNVIESKHFKKNKQKLYFIARQIDSGQILFDTGF